MKNNLTIKLQFIGIVSLLIATSCSGPEKKETTVAENEGVEKNISCICANLIEMEKGLFYKDGVPYTGSCETLDQHNTVIEKNDYVNGIRVFKYSKERVGDKYFTSDSLFFESGVPVNGFSIKFSENYGVNFVYKVEEYNNNTSRTGGEIHFGFQSAYFTGFGRGEEIRSEVPDESRENMRIALEETINKVNKLYPRFIIISRN